MTLDTRKMLEDEVTYVTEENKRLRARIAKLEAVIKPLRSVVSEEGVRGMLLCYCLGCEMLDALKACEEP